MLGVDRQNTGRGALAGLLQEDSRYPTGGRKEAIMTEESGSRGYRPQLRADPVVERLAPEQAPHETGVPLTGFLGPAGVEGRWRLYASRAFDDNVEFDESDVIDSETSDDSSAGSTIWLKAGASVKHTRVSSRQVQASFLSGE